MNGNNLKDIILYLIFGVLTTIINIVIYLFTTRIMGVPVVPSVIIAWTAAVFFAYYTNSRYVFHSKARTFSDMFHEATSFFACRLATGFMDVLIMYIFVDLLAFNDLAIKVISNILVVILNYVASKLLIFKSKEEKK